MRPAHSVRVLVYTLLTVLAFSSFLLMVGKPFEGATDQSEILRRFGDAPFAIRLKRATNTAIFSRNSFYCNIRTNST